MNEKISDSKTRQDLIELLRSITINLADNNIRTELGVLKREDISLEDKIDLCGAIYAMSEFKKWVISEDFCCGVICVDSSRDLIVYELPIEDIEYLVDNKNCLWLWFMGVIRADLQNFQSYLNNKAIRAYCLSDLNMVFWKNKREKQNGRI